MHDDHSQYHFSLYAQRVDLYCQPSECHSLLDWGLDTVTYSKLTSTEESPLAPLDPSDLELLLLEPAADEVIVSALPLQPFEVTTLSSTPSDLELLLEPTAEEMVCALPFQPFEVATLSTSSDLELLLEPAAVETV